jgi:mono/diheme cytochrome c family protein
MRIVALAELLLLVAVFSCNRPQTANRLANGDKLPSAFFSIDPNKDTVLVTADGTKISIPAGALDAGGADSVHLEIKEANTIEAIINGRLVTTSAGQPLSSGGMLMIEAAPGRTVTMRKALGISVPAQNFQQGMMAFKGQIDDSGAISWVDPRALDDNPTMRLLNAGSKIFQASCATCHSLQGSSLGPALGWITQRRNKQWLIDFTRNNARMLWRGDAYTCFLFNRYDKTPMNPFPNLSDTDLEGVFAYITSASQSIDSNTVPDLKRTYDSCLKYDPDCGRPHYRVRGGNELVTTDSTQMLSDARVVASSSYSFSINTFGWYGLGVFLKNVPGVEESELLVEGDYRSKNDVFLAIPSLRVLTVVETEKMPLPQHVVAHVLVMDGAGDESLFGKTTFFTSHHQRIAPNPTQKTPDAIARAIRELAADRDKAQAADSAAIGANAAGGASDGANAVAMGSSGATGAANAGATGAASAGATPATKSIAAIGPMVRPAQSCPCWCDQSDYRKADSIARSGTGGRR